MHAVIRTYSGTGAKELFDLLETRKGEVHGLMQPIKGFVSYYLIRSGDGGASVTVCQDESGLDEGARIAKQWIATNASHIRAAPPVVSRGPVIVHLSADEAIRTAIPLQTAS